MKTALCMLGDLSLRWKILLPFVALSLVTWLIAAEIMRNSSEKSIRVQGQAEAHQAATTTARHLELRATALRDQVMLLTVEGELMMGDRGLKETLGSLGPDLLQAFTDEPKNGQAFRSDLVEVIDPDGRTRLQLRRHLLEIGTIDDDIIVAAAREGRARGGIVAVSTGSRAYVIGAAPFDIGGFRQPLVLLLGVTLDAKMLAEVGLAEREAVFVVGPEGVLAADGATSSDARWEDLLMSDADGGVTFDGAGYRMSSVPLDLPLTPGLRVVVATPTAPLSAVAATGRSRAWLVLSAGLLAFVAVALWLSTLLTRPLRDVTAAARKLADGDMEARTPVLSGDEIGRLALAFNRMGSELESRSDRLSKAFDEMRRLSETDELTGLLNHRAIHVFLEREIARAQRYGLALGVVIIDIDNFKLLNDTYGHPAGDLVIKQVAAVLAGNTRAADIVSRHGGDEFMVILPETDPEESLAVAHKLRVAMHEHPMVAADGLQIPIRLSIGTASFPEDGTQLNDIVAYADANLYTSKRRGGDMVTRGDEKEQLAKLSGGGFSMLDAMVTAVDNKDRYTRRHSEDVTALSLRMAERLGLGDETQRILRLAGLLHDVGKIGVPDAILRKPGRLTADEYEIVKHHAKLGGIVIRGVPHEDDIRSAVLAHHERWDGHGYPAGEKGTAIPLLGRILAVADAYSAMTSDRPYRQAMSEEEAMHEMTQGSGTQFDPAMLQVFRLIVAERGDAAEEADAFKTPEAQPAI